jgi:hypothetical protein
MATTTIVCNACGAGVPNGRLSCPECGELLASVAGTRWNDGAPSTSAAATHAAPAPATAFTPGAYVPPVAPPVPTLSIAAPAPAREWAGTDGLPPLDESAHGSAPAGKVTAAKADKPTVELSKVDEFIGWLSVAGSALAAVGFILPWSNSVIGATGIGYFDRWGLAGPGHIVVVVGLLVLLGLGVVRMPVPAWVRLGIPGVGLGALLLGLAWPYLVGPLGIQAGLLAVVIGAALILIAGILAIATGRHADSTRSV